MGLRRHPHDDRPRLVVQVLICEVPPACELAQAIGRHGDLDPSNVPGRGGDAHEARAAAARPSPQADGRLAVKGALDVRHRRPADWVLFVKVF